MHTYVRMGRYRKSYCLHLRLAAARPRIGPDCCHTSRTFRWRQLRSASCVARRFWLSRVSVVVGKGNRRVCSGLRRPWRRHLYASRYVSKPLAMITDRPICHSDRVQWPWDAPLFSAPQHSQLRIFFTLPLDTGSKLPQSVQNTRDPIAAILIGLLLFPSRITIPPRERREGGREGGR